MSANEGAHEIDEEHSALATVGEFWMIGYLLIRGVRSHVEPPIAMPEHAPV